MDFTTPGKTIAFFLHNRFDQDIFSGVGRVLKEKYDCEIIFIQDVGDIDGEQVLQFEVEMEKIWNHVDISYSSLCNVEKKYSQVDLLRALYGERRNIFYPKYFYDEPVPYLDQLRYLVCCFTVFEKWLDENKVDLIVSELLVGLPDSVLLAVCDQRSIQYISLRSSKLLPGVIRCVPDNDMPEGMLERYENFLQEGIPSEFAAGAKTHVDQLRTKILTPHYMQITQKNLCLFHKTFFFTLLSRLTVDKKPTNEISLTKRPVRQSILWKFYRYINVRRTNKNKEKWFCPAIQKEERYFIFPLQYEPENSTLIRAFPFSDQLFVIQQIAKALPLGVFLVVKEHMGNQGYRKPSFYNDLQYLPNVKLVDRKANLYELLRNSIGVVTLTSRMGWEALILKKPVITLGNSFWSSFETVQRPDSWEELKRMLKECVENRGEKIKHDYDKKLLAYAAAYISLVHEGNFVFLSEDVLTPQNYEKIATII